ncbi:MAG: hypothetical protein QHI38_04805 [Armatimonadota bacterium]|nr:hypothetical protein [Armatimonadota bacterium]
MISCLALVLVCLLAASEASTGDYKTMQPYTSFQTPTEYRLDNDIRTDAVIVYSDIKERIQSWKDKGYVVQTMYGFRTGEEYVEEHRGEVQTTADGTLLTCGPGSYYMVPTPNRIKAALDYFTNAIANGTSAVIPEEPEFFASAGYSESFKQAWREYYGEPWLDPASSVQARWKSERLKAKMEYDMVKAIMDAAEKQNPRVRRMVACHSAVNYYGWGIVYPHYQCFALPNLQEIIGQVWTGTARSACRYEGVMAERTFENGFLEYSSLYNLVRGSGKRLWFLMDPLEDNPDRTMEDYRDNYHKTLVASLMFPEVDAYEVMPWPTRIYGRVPDEFSTEIGSIVNALQDMHNHKDARWDTGTQGIAVFVADSMGWQRGSPHMSNYDCFYGLTLPLVYRGIPVQVAQLERTPERGYLDPYKVILLSYDIMKPMKPEYNQALADWVKQGGVLVFFGGTDAYNNLPEWWKKRGYDSPQADLYARLGARCRLVSHIGPGVYEEIDREKKAVRDARNRRVYRYDLTRFAEQIDSGDAIYVRFRDAFPEDGWGAAVSWVRLVVDGVVKAFFKAGSEQEKEYLAQDGGSFFNGRVRFADGDAFWVYRFPVSSDSKPILEVEMENQFVVEVSIDPQTPQFSIRGKPLFEPKGWFEVPSQFPLTLVSLCSDKLLQGQLYSGPGDDCAVVEHPCGKGSLIHVGIAPSYFASSKEAADILRRITAYACGKAGMRYREQRHMAVRRGPYVAVRTFEDEKRLEGWYVDILDPNLPVVKDPVVGPQRCAFYRDVTNQLAGEPRLLHCAYRLEEKTETADYSRFRVSGPEGTKGIVRVAKNGRRPAEVSPAECLVEEDAQTLAVRFSNKPESVTLEIKWQ